MIGDNTMSELVNVSYEIEQGKNFSNYFANFLAEIDITETTKRIYEKNIKNFMTFLYANNIHTPTENDIKNYRAALEEQGKKPRTIQNYMTTVKMFFSYLANKGVYLNVAKFVKTLPKGKASELREHSKDCLTAKNVKTLLKSCKRDTPTQKRDYALLVLCVACGLRTIETVRADVQDLTTSAGDTVLFIQGKGRNEKAEFVKVPEKVEDAIRDYLATRENLKGTDPLFTSVSNHNANERMTTRSISRIIKNHLVSAGFNSDRLTAHSLRHTAVTLALLNGNSLEQAQQFARHRNPQTTMIYNHAINAHNNNCAESVASAIF